MIDAYEFTHEFLEDVGARLEPSKSATFSSETDTRKRLRARVWPKAGGAIKVVNSFRDLGSQINLNKGSDSKASASGDKGKKRKRTK